MLPAFDLSCSEMMCGWEKMVLASGSYELDVWPYLETLSGDVISRTAFGSNYKEGRRIFQLQKEQAQLIIQALNSVYIPGWRLKLFTKKFNDSIQFSTPSVPYCQSLYGIQLFKRT